jgi:EAL domain-containing protein (putative c-di-GMP-specific phosphodiesterase class I)
MFLCVNVSAREIQQPGFVEGVQDTLQEAGLEATRLILEITETALLRATPATVSTLDDLRLLGVRVVIDDFGTGYFSLSHLRQFPVDAIKIASEFVQDMEPGSRSSALAGAIVALSRSLGIDTIAEGIETVEQATRMRALGATFGQGFFFAKPLAAADVVTRLEPSDITNRVPDAGPSGDADRRRTPHPAQRVMVRPASVDTASA